ncbi:MAG: hypothetical protein LBP72_00140, partial [Dysgonamonadaceae bacterium]|nr:hypothetical protein [Dysgonamonadaceae bacterium]
QSSDFPCPFEDFGIMGMNEQIHFVNLPVQFGSRVAFPACSPRFNVPQPFLDFQFGTELGDCFADDDFSDNRINRFFPGN